MVVVAVVVPIVVAVVVPVVVPIVVVVMTVATIVVVPVIVSIMPVIASVVRLVFCRSYEVHRPIAGVILAAVLAPILRMTRRHVQVDGRRRGRLRLDQHRLCIDDGRRRGVADLNLAIDTGRHLSRHDDIDAQISSAAYASTRECGCRNRPHEQ
jgi:hypothetical protein